LICFTHRTLLRPQAAVANRPAPRNSKPLGLSLAARFDRAMLAHHDMSTGTLSFAPGFVRLTLFGTHHTMNTQGFVILLIPLLGLIAIFRGGRFHKRVVSSSAFLSVVFLVRLDQQPHIRFMDIGATMSHLPGCGVLSPAQRRAGAG
jgi:hypothetical protein